jgi:hypothetical protein
MTAICVQNSRSLSAGRVQGRRTSDTAADSRLEVAPDPGFHLRRSPLTLEALQVEAEPLCPLPEVWIVDPPSIRIERIDHLEEATLHPRGLGGGVQRRRAGVLAGHWEMPEGDLRPPLADLRPGGGAVRTTEVGVDDQRLALAPNVIFGADRGDGCAGQLGRQTPTVSSASKITFAPGISSGVGDSCTHSIVPPSSTRTSERFACPTLSM